MDFGGGARVSRLPCHNSYVEQAGVQGALAPAGVWGIPKIPSGGRDRTTWVGLRRPMANMPMANFTQVADPKTGNADPRLSR